VQEDGILYDGGVGGGTTRVPEEAAAARTWPQEQDTV